MGATCISLLIPFCSVWSSIFKHLRERERLADRILRPRTSGFKFGFAKVYVLLQGRFMRTPIFFPVYFCLALLTCGAAPSDNGFDGVKPIPPPGIAISQAARAELEKGAAD